MKYNISTSYTVGGKETKRVSSVDESVLKETVGKTSGVETIICSLLNKILVISYETGCFEKLKEIKIDITSIKSEKVRYNAVLKVDKSKVDETYFCMLKAIGIKQLEKIIEEVKELVK